MFGSHLSIAGSMTNALQEAERLGLDTVQVFTKNQQQWKAKPLEKGAIDEWRSEQSRLGWNDRTVSHASYLINLASFNPELWQKSVDLMTDEIERCELLGIPYLVHHPGSYTGTTLDAGLANITRAYRELLKRTKGYRTVVCLEATAGAGRSIGGRFEELGQLRSMIAEKTGSADRVGFCLDTCHMHAAGYDIATRAGGERALAEFDRLCGIKNLRVMHFNDSKGAPGSKLDRHQHIGAGTIGAPDLSASGFAAIVNAAGMKDVPKILETPKENNESGIPWDTVNVERLRSLAVLPGGKPARTPKITIIAPAASTPMPNTSKVKPVRKPKATPATKKTGKAKR